MEGDLIECLNAGDGSWWMGRLKRDRRAVGLFPSNFVEILPETFQPAPISRNASPLPLQPPQPSPAKQKSVFRKPFTAYAAPRSPNPEAAEREVQKKGGSLTPLNVKESKHRPYSAMKRPSNERSSNGSRDSHGSRDSLPGTQTPSKSKLSHMRSVSPAPPLRENQGHDRFRAVSPRPNMQSRGPSPAPQMRSRGPSPARLQYHSSNIRAASPNPAQYQNVYDRPLSRSQSSAFPRMPSPAPSNVSRGPSPAPYRDDYQFSRGLSPNPDFDTGHSPPPPPPPAHRVPYTTNRAPSPQPMLNNSYQSRVHTPEPQSASDGGSGMTPSPLTQHMNDVMSSLQDMGTRDRSPSPEEKEPDTPPNVWSPEAFGEIYTASAKKHQANTSIGHGFHGDSGYGTNDEHQENMQRFKDVEPPQLQSYVQRMESRL
ncbi:hypothetical protein LTS18_010937, partial [Coniosporium uncinatum]